MISIELYSNGLIVSGHANADTKGKDIYLNRGETIRVILVDPIDVPII